MKQNRRFLRLIKEAKGNWAKREDKEFMNFPFSCSLISRGMVKCMCMRKALCARSRQQQTRKDEDHMKKFLSLLLALTMVLSLVVVPARATATDTVQGVTLTGATIEKSGNATLTLDTSHASLIADSTKTLQAGTNEWSTSSESVATVNNGTVTAVAAGTATITCVAKFTYSDNDSQSQNAQVKR